MYDKKTRLLTKLGMKKFDQIKEGELLLSFTDKLIETEVKKINVKEFKGDLFRFDSFLFTEDEIPEIKEIPKWEGVESETVNGYNTNKWFYLVGIYIANGFTKDKVQLNVSVGEARRKTKEVLKDFGIKSKRMKKSFVFEKIEFPETIPDWMLDYDQKHLQFLLDGLIDNKKSNHAFYTDSEELKDKVCNLSIKLGIYPRVIKSNNHFSILLKIKPEFRQRFVVPYEGIVWSVEVKGKYFIERMGSIISK